MMKRLRFHLDEALAFAFFCVFTLLILAALWVVELWYLTRQFVTEQ
jgi:cell division protein FtsL